MFERILDRRLLGVVRGSRGSHVTHSFVFDSNVALTICSDGTYRLEDEEATATIVGEGIVRYSQDTTDLGSLLAPSQA